MSRGGGMLWAGLAMSAEFICDDRSFGSMVHFL